MLNIYEPLLAELSSKQEDE